jgi:hypothetical protein
MTTELLDQVRHEVAVAAVMAQYDRPHLHIPAPHGYCRRPSPLLVLNGEEPVYILGSPKGPLWGANGRLRRMVQGGAVTVSGGYILTWKDFWDNSDVVFDYINDTIKGALFTNTITPNFSSDTAYAAAPYNANEVSGTGYSAGGVTLGTKTLTESPTGTLMFDSADLVWSGATFSNARCRLTWDDTTTTPVADVALWLVNYGADYGVTAGTLTEQVPATGSLTIDLTP